MQTHTLVRKDPSYASVMPHSIESTFSKTDATIPTTHSFGDDRQRTADDSIQKQKLASTKK